MPDFIKTQNSFAYGEVAPEFYARDDINGLSRLENMDVLPGGGITRRRGLKKLVNLNGVARLIPFSVSEDENYLLAVCHKRILVYKDNGDLAQDILAPWEYKDSVKLQYAQRFGTMIFVHPDFKPMTLSRDPTIFRLAEFFFAANEDLSLNMPFMKFDDAEGVRITVSTHPLGNNFATFTTNKDFWTPENVTGRLLVMGRQWNIHTYVSPTEIVVYLNGPYSLPSGPVSDWSECAFGKRRGWPCSISFHQDRLVFGGSRSWPSGVWMSQVGRHTNFNVGTGLDDEAIFLTLLSQKRQQICTVVSSDNLQILTSEGEWAISSKPLTPSVVNIKQHTSVGSVAGRYLPPQKIEGATVFISGSKKDIRELSLDQLGENYNATDLCAFAKHLMSEPVDVAYNEETNQLFIVMENGDMAVLNQKSSLGISAWGRYKTDGKFKSVAVVNGKTFVVVERETGFFIETFSDDAIIDAEKYQFSFTAAALPLHASGHNPSRLRLRKIGARVLKTKSLFINNMRVELPNDIYDINSPGFSGDVAINLLGTKYDCIAAPWTIHGDEAFPVTVLSITMYGRYTV